MFYSIVHYPKIDKLKINEFRRKYDPYVNLVDAHITIVFPLPAKIGQGALVDHVSRQLDGWEPFEVKIKGLEKAWDHWLFLTLGEGNRKVIELHDKLYGGILVPYLRSDIEFIPHIGIGLFVKKRYDLRDPKAVEFDQKTYDFAMEEARALDNGQTFLIDTLSLIEIDNDFKTTKTLKEFKFQTRVSRHH